jgi:hypothetical protein
MAAKKMYINGVEINAKLIPDLTALTAVEVTDTTKKSIPVADEDSPNDEAKRMLLSELANLLTDGAVVKIYEAIISQTGTNAPVATILKNTLGGTPIWSRDGVGNYYLTLNGAFPQTKTLLPPAIATSSGSLLLPLNNGDNNSINFYSINLEGETPTTPIDIEQQYISIQIKIHP